MIIVFTKILKIVTFFISVRWTLGSKTIPNVRTNFKRLILHHSRFSRKFHSSARFFANRKIRLVSRFCHSIPIYRRTFPNFHEKFGCGHVLYPCPIWGHFSPNCGPAGGKSTRSPISDIWGCYPNWRGCSLFLTRDQGKEIAQYC